MSPPGKPGLQGHARPEVGVEVDVLDAPDVGALVNVNPDLERAGEHVADQVQLVPPAAHVNGLVGVGERDIQDLAQLAIGADGPRIGRHLGEGLFGIMDDQVPHHGVRLERDQRLAVRLAAAARKPAAPCRWGARYGARRPRRRTTSRRAGRLAAASRR